MSWSPSSSPCFLWIFNPKRNSGQGELWNETVQGKRKRQHVHLQLVISNSINHIHKFPESQLRGFGGLRMGTEKLPQNSIIQWFLAKVSCFMWYKHYSRQQICRQTILKKVNSQILLKWAPALRKSFRVLKNFKKLTTISKSLHRGNHLFRASL